MTPPDDDCSDLIGSRKLPRGRPPHEPTPETREKVSLWASVGTTQAVIATELGICIDTLAKFYREELDAAADRAVARIAGTLYSKALAGDTTSAIFYLKTRGRWSEKASVGDEDNPLVIKTDAGDQTLSEALEIAKQAARMKKPGV